MSDRLEDFIRNSRREFDLEEPPAELWSRIEGELDKKKPKQRSLIIRLNPVIRIAAVLLIVAGAGLVFIEYRRSADTDVRYINPELAEKQAHYTSIIEERQQELLLVKTQEPALYKEFSSEISELEVNYERLRNDLPTSPNREETLKAMIRNLKIQAEVLSQQLNIIQEIQQFKKEQQHDDRNI